MVDMISIFEANVDFLVGAADRYGTDTDAELINGAVKDSACDQSANFIINKLATLLVLVLSWISIGEVDCKRVDQMHACKVVFIVMYKTNFYTTSGQQRHGK